MAQGTVLIGFLEPLTDARGDRARCASAACVAFAMESIPRITRAQSMDALSSQATVAGYKAVVLAADRLPRLFPMLMTAAGHDRAGARARHRRRRRRAAGDRDRAPARRRRLGLRRAARGRRSRSRASARRSSTSASDGEETAGGYATRADARAAGAAAGRARGAHPRLRRRDHDRRRPGPPRAEAHPDERGRAHAPGSVIVDLAAETGGNCELTEPGEVVEHAGVTIIGTTQPALARWRYHASQLYSRNVGALLQHLAPGRRAHARLGRRDHARRVRHADRKERHA